MSICSSARLPSASHWVAASTAGTLDAATPMTPPQVEQRGEDLGSCSCTGVSRAGRRPGRPSTRLPTAGHCLYWIGAGLASPPADGDDFEVDARDIAEALGDGAHLVAHSYGGVGALLAAAARPQAGSLSYAALSRWRTRSLLIRARPSVCGSGSGILRGPPCVCARVRLEGFFELMGLQAKLPDPLPPALDTSTRLLMRCRYPWTAPNPSR